MNTPSSEALLEPKHPVSLGFQVLLGLANAGAIITLIPVLVVLIPAQTTHIDPITSANSLAFVLALGAAGALVGNPLAGALSDRTTSRWGRRRPWLLTGMLGTAGGLTLLANSTSIPLLAAAWMIVQFFGNILLSAYGAILPDRVPIRQRGTTQAIIGLSSPVAIIFSDVLIARAANYHNAYYPIIFVMVALTTTFILLYREAQLPAGSLPQFQLRAFMTSFWINPRKFPSFALLWVMWFMVWSGYNLGTGSFFYLYLQNIVNYEALFPGHHVKEAAATLQMLQIAVGVPLMMACGVLSDRIGQRKPFVLAGIGLVGIGAVALIFSSGWPAALAAGVTIGAGFWIFYSLGLALITQMLPSASDRGKDLGVMNVAATLPQILIPPAGAAIITTLGLTNPLSFKILFTIGAGCIAVALFLLSTSGKKKESLPASDAAHVSL